MFGGEFKSLLSKNLNVNFLPLLPTITGLYANGLGRDVDAGDRLMTSAIALVSIGPVEYDRNADQDFEMSEEFKSELGQLSAWPNIHSRSGRDRHQVPKPPRTRRP